MIMEREAAAAGRLPPTAPSESDISNLITDESNGRVGFKLRDVEDLLALYGVTDKHDLSEILALVGQSNVPGWWTRYSDILPDIVYVEQLTSALYLDQRTDVEHYLEVVDQLSGAALTPGQTRDFIQQVINET